MQFPRWSLIQTILLLLGLHPFWEQQKPKWHQKIHRIGALLCLNQILLTIFTFSLERSRGVFYQSFSNIILHGTVMGRRFFALALPLVSILFKFLKMEPLGKFCENLNLLEEFRNGQQRQEDVAFDYLEWETQQKIQRVNFWSGVVVITVTLLNFMFSMHFGLFVQLEAFDSWFTLYFYHSMILMHLAIALNIYATSYGVALRQDLFCAFVQRISNIRWPSVGEESEERRQRINKVFLWGLGKWMVEKNQKQQ